MTNIHLTTNEEPMLTFDHAWSNQDLGTEEVAA